MTSNFVNNDWTGLSSTTVSDSCGFKTLNNYNKSTMGVPVAVPQTVGKYLIPNYSAPGYGTLVDAAHPCSGYFTINSAYGDCAKQTSSYRSCM